MSYTPQAGSMVSKLIDFFNINGDEELTASDIAEKFGVGASGVHTNLFNAIEAHLIVRKKNEDGEYVYAHPAAASTKGQKAEPAMPARSGSPFTAHLTVPVKQKRQPPISIDLATLELEEGVPVTTARQSLDWPGLFNRMKPGQSCVLPRSAYSSCAKAMTDFKKTTRVNYSASRSATSNFVCGVWLEFETAMPIKYRKKAQLLAFGAIWESSQQCVLFVFYFLNGIWPKFAFCNRNKNGGVVCDVNRDWRHLSAPSKLYAFHHLVVIVRRQLRSSFQKLALSLMALLQPYASYRANCTYCCAEQCGNRCIHEHLFELIRYLSLDVFLDQQKRGGNQL